MFNRHKRRAEKVGLRPVINEQVNEIAPDKLKDQGMIDIEKKLRARKRDFTGTSHGCTGARQMVTGMYHMKNKGYNTGLFTMCIGGGMGMTMIVER